MLTPEDRELIRQLYRIAQRLVIEWEQDAGEYSYRVYDNFSEPLDRAIREWEDQQQDTTNADA